MVIALLGVLTLIGSAGAGDFSWFQAEGSVGLKHGEATVWALKITKGDCKPCFHPLSTVDGFVLSDYRPADHLWHTGLWFCFKTINGENYWEEDPKTLLSRGRTKVVEEDRVRKVKSSAGKLEDGILSIPASEAAQFVVTLHLRQPSASTLNLARLALASSPGQADHEAQGPMAAIDGNEETYWDETDDQDSYLLTIDLPLPKRVNRISLLGYKHHQFAPKDFDVLVDGKTVRGITGARYTDNRLVIDFDDVEGQKIELRIAGSYGPSPAIRELNIFAQ